MNAFAFPPATLAEIEREARHVVERIRELEGLNSRFDSALVRAEDERNLHLAKIAGEQSHLLELREAAARIVTRLGETGPVAEAEVTEAEVAAVMAEDAPEPFEGYSDLPDLADLTAEEQAAVEAVPDDGTPFEAVDDAPFADAGDPADELFEEPDALTAKIQSAIVEIAPSPPAHPDETDAPEMTDEQVEVLVLERMEAAPVQEPTVDAYINPSPAKKLFPWAT